MEEKFEGTLDEFLDSMDSLESMETDKCLSRLSEEGEDPLVKLYKDGKLVASTYPNDLRDDKTVHVRDMGYRFLKGLRYWNRVKKDPLSIGDMECRENWGGVTGKMYSAIEGSLEALKSVGLLRYTHSLMVPNFNTLGRPNSNSSKFYDLESTNRFKVVYNKPGTYAHALSK
ncbi:hypothetical protein J4414_00880 [Candidatus Woesearchaeota archaeon]|nr:hypothetical protein [Candidatus Woesearchaeota archaeon]